VRSTLPRRIALAALLVTGSACRGGLTGTSDLVAGVYTLQTANGQPLPYLLVFIDQDNKLEFTAGSVTIVDDGSFVDSATFLVTESGVQTSQTQVVSGQWTQKGGRITFTPDDGTDPYVMTWNGTGRLVQGFQDVTLAYFR